MERSLQECAVVAKKMILEQELVRVMAAFARAGDEEERTRLLQQKITLSRQIREVV